LAGVGGMGEVFRAIDRTAGGAVAVKVLFDRHGARDVRFEREATLLADIQHPGLVRYLDYGVMESGRQYLVMEWLDGEAPSQRLVRDRLSIDETITLGLRAAEALAAVHTKGIIHCDLKPSNLFLVGGRPDTVKLLDFGIARMGGVTTTQSGPVP